MTETLGQRLKARRLELGLTQVEVKELCGVRQERLSQIERGVNPNPRFLTMQKLSAALKFPLDHM